MECITCKVEKLSKEFPPVPASEKCNHPLLSCLRCVVNASKFEKKECPYEGCRSIMDDKKIELYEKILDYLFQEYEVVYIEEIQLDLGKEDLLTVCTLDGTTLSFEYNENMTTFELKERLTKELECEIKYQKLVYNSQTLDNMTSESRRATLKNYGIPANSKVYFVKLLCELQSSIEELVFDIEWGYPTTQETILFGLVSYTKHHRDYLDASCLIFTKENSTPRVVNVWNKSTSAGGIKHDREYIDRNTKRGHHTIKVCLPEVHDDVNYLFFTLSAREFNRKVSDYTNPVLKIYDQTHEERHELCSTSLDNVDHEQAIIVCCVHRAEDAIWRVINISEPSKGNRENYSPMIKKMNELIKKGTI